MPAVNLDDKPDIVEDIGGINEVDHVFLYVRDRLVAVPLDFHRPNYTRRSGSKKLSGTAGYSSNDQSARRQGRRSPARNGSTDSPPGTSTRSGTGAGSRTSSIVSPFGGRP